MNNSTKRDMKTSSRIIAEIAKTNHSKVKKVITELLEDGCLSYAELNYWVCKQNKQTYTEYFVLDSELEIVVKAAEPKRADPNYRKKTISKRKRQITLEKHNYQCSNCKTKEDLCIDHKLPEKRGGTNDLSNLQVLCRSCNSKKGTKTMDEWLGVQ